MSHTIEAASSGRAKCRGCSELIAKGDLRFGERLPNPFADGDMTVWFHPLCAAYRRPESVQECIDEVAIPCELEATLRAAFELSLSSHRACRLGKAQRASSGRARCRHCREVIAKDTWRLPLLFFEEGIFNGSGFIHAGCVQAYTGSADMEPLVSHFARDLDDADRQTVLDCVRQQVSG